MSLNIVIIGAVAAGPKAAARLKRVNPAAKVTMIDKDPIISYGGCGIPYFVSGDVADLSGLRSTSFHMVRNEAFFKGAKGVDVLAGWEVLSIDRANKSVLAQKINSSEQKIISYDKLIISTGSKPNLPSIEGIELNNVIPVANLHQADMLKQNLAKGQIGSAAVIGAGPTGLEMAEAMADLWGVEVDVFEMADQVLPGLIDKDMAEMIHAHLKEKEIRLHLNAKIQKLSGDEENNVNALVYDSGKIDTDFVVIAAGVKPETELAEKAGIELAENGGIKVDEYLTTSDPDILAGGDCVSLKNLLGGRDTVLASGSLANRMGRILGTNAVGGKDRFRGIYGSWIMKVFDLAAGKVGLTDESARAAGYDPVSLLVVASDRAHFFPTQELMYLKMTADRKTRKVLGLQGISPNGDALSSRIDALAGLLVSSPTVEDAANLEMAYAPPFSAAMDIINSAANALANVLDGRFEFINPSDLKDRLDMNNGQTVFLDVRDIRNAQPYLDELSEKGWMNIPQEKLADNLDKIPTDKDIITICNAGSRSYEAIVTLKAAGITNIKNLAGGMAGVKICGWNPIQGNGEKKSG